MKIEVNINKRYFIILISFIAILGVVLITNAFGGNDPGFAGHSLGELDFSQGQANSDLDLGGNNLINYGNDFASQNWVNNNFYTQEELYTSSEIDNTFVTQESLEGSSGNFECTTASTGLSYSGSTVNCPSGYARTGCSMDFNHGQWTRLWAMRVRPSGSDGCYCKPTYYVSSGNCYAYCCRVN